MKKQNGANLGFEKKLWEMADKLRGHMDASEYKHVVLGLIFLKYISDAFRAKYEELSAIRETDYTDPEDRDEYLAANTFWVPPEARWVSIQAQAPQPTIGRVIDEAMAAIERENPSLKRVLPKDYSRSTLDKTRLGELVKMVGDIDLKARKSGVKDPLGRVYEYFSTPPRYRSPCGSRRATRRHTLAAASATAAARPSSLTPAAWGIWWTGCIAN